ncbi:GNAT family N-acetyltransferase [Dyella sp. M7H15-1]|uniref:GNAT family N-acetyltransferase n=1 Tax=Dyella sp. M7H15-1 TaxID=2501295 RepID=UPI0013E8A47D|nr:GNAT family N-acetyltransferase [Dyella sp. M7H15-1]
MRNLYGELHMEELHLTGWPAAMCKLFLDDQFALQHRHFVDYYGESDFLIVESGDTAIGRYYLLRQEAYFLVVDVALLPTWRGQGIGSSLLQWSQSMACENKAAGIDLHVNILNVAAHRLYTRLGFVTIEPEPPYIRMRWMVN